jgi:aspartate/methionine/tyrosine aminotransferase
MTDILLAKPKLSEGWIDCATGESHIVREALINAFDLDSSIYHSKYNKMEYQPPNGYDPLVKLLENKHQAPVIITNGAKQALSASFYALHKIGKRRLGMRTPYWALIPPLANANGLECCDKYDCYLAVLPNNPDNYMQPYYDASIEFYSCKEQNIPVIHDAVYYSPSYIPYDTIYGALGDLQIFSASKSLGLSGLRIGYVVCHDTSYYKNILEYIEMMTVGVSLPSQSIYYDLLQEMDACKDRTEKFIAECRSEFYAARALCKTIKKSVLEVPEDILNSCGMFCWAKRGENCDFENAKIHIIDGGSFGDQSKVRLNLGLPVRTIAEVVERLNSL